MLFIIIRIKLRKYTSNYTKGSISFNLGLLIIEKVSKNRGVKKTIFESIKHYLLFLVLII